MYRSPSGYAYLYLNDQYRHPVPSDDDKLMRALGEKSYRGLFFAFASLEQLKFWIHRDEDREALSADGLRVFVLQARDVWVGDTQCVYDKDHATVVDDLCLTEIEDYIK